MKPYYQDIRNKIKEKPLWYDENGTPRYARFCPNLTSNIYAKEIILLEIACQHCHKRFLVEMTFSNFNKIFDTNKKSFTERLNLYFKEKKDYLLASIHYGDPPNHNCVGDTENCDDLRIVEFWKDEKEFKRIKKYEIELMKEE